jgi:hypothetical protein
VVRDDLDRAVLLDVHDATAHRLPIGEGSTRIRSPGRQPASGASTSTRMSASTRQV